MLNSVNEERSDKQKLSYTRIDGDTKAEERDEI
jgi:hypothetical protein